LEAWLDEAYDTTLKPPFHSGKYTKWGQKALRRFLEERLARRIASTVVRDDRVVLDLPGMVDVFQDEADKIAQIGAGTAGATFTEGWDKQGGIKMRPTSVSFLDDFLGGGHAPGECYGLLGPFGSCKTTTGLMLAVNACEAAAEEEADQDWDGKRSLAFFVSYEARLDNEIRLRTLSYAAEIRRNSLETMGSDGLAGLSDADNLKKYEQKKYKTDILDGEYVKGEQERAASAIERLNRHLRVLDMTGYDENARGAGGGYIKEIARRISAELRKEKNAKVAIVVVDYVGAMVKRHLAAAEKDDNALRHLITGAGLSARNLLADQFNCPVWLLHQLSGQANEKSPGAKLDHTNSAESKSFAENLDFAFVVGKLTDDNLCQIVCSKHRRTGGHDAKVLKVVGEFNVVEDRSTEFFVNHTAGQIQSKDIGTSATTQKKAAKVLASGGHNDDAQMDSNFHDQDE
jgi:RecA/RadA recombinase